MTDPWVGALLAGALAGAALLLVLGSPAPAQPLACALAMLGAAVAGAVYGGRGARLRDARTSLVIQRVVNHDLREEMGALHPLQGVQWLDEERTVQVRPRPDEDTEDHEEA